MDYCQVRQGTNSSRHSHIKNFTGLAVQLSYLFNNSPTNIMATQSTLNSFAMDLDSASQVSSMPASSQINIPTELQHTNDFASNTGNRPITQPIKLTYYDEINFDHVAPGYAPCVDGKGQVNSWIWAHGWRLQQQDTVRPVYYWLCKICFKQRKHLAKPIKCSSGTTGVHNHLQRLHSIKRDEPD
jgi:hypothetical protein